MIVTLPECDVRACEVRVEPVSTTSRGSEVWTFFCEAREHGFDVVVAHESVVTTHENSPTSTSAAGAQEIVRVSFIDELRDAHRRFVFNFPVLLKQTFDDGVHIIENRDLGLFVFEESESQAQAALASQFGRLWDDIAQEGVTPLAQSAKQLGEALRFSVAKVEEIGG